MNISNDVFYPREDVNLMMFAGFNEGEEDASGASAEVITMEEPVLASNDKWFNRAFGFIVINFKAAILEIN